MIKCVPTFEALKCSPSPLYAQFIKLTGAGGEEEREAVYGADETRTPPPPLSRPYRDINQLSASDKIGCSGSERFSKRG